MTRRRSSRRFDQNWLTARLVPALLILLVLALVATLMVIALSMANII
jgi:hypothetical protein